MLDVDAKRMIVEAGHEIQELGADLLGYLGVIGVSASTYGHWMREDLAGRLVEAPPREPTQAERAPWDGLREKMRDLAHRRHYTFGLNPLRTEYRGRVTREKFRELAREVRAQVNRERRKGWLRYEFAHPDVAHSMDLMRLPHGVESSGHRYMARIMDDCTRCTLWKGITRTKGLHVGLHAVQRHLKENNAPLVLKFDLEFGHPQMETLLLAHEVVPLPNPPGYPRANAKPERGNRDVGDWFKGFGPDQDWTDPELQKELNFCFTEIDGLWEREEFGGGTRRQAYASMPRASVDRAAFLREVKEYRLDLLRRPDNRLSPMQAWRVAVKEILKKFNLVRYVGPQEV